MSVKFTIGMAHFEDYHGAVFTIQSILGSPDASLVGEVIVIDSSPGSSHSAHLKTFCENVSKPDCRVRFIEYTGPNSTTQPRQAIFDHAAFPYVLVMDCHVLLSPGFLRRLEDAYQTAARDALITGPIYQDNLQWGMTHFDLTWRGQMWGIWATAWTNPSGSVRSIHKDEATGSCAFYAVGYTKDMIRVDGPELPYEQHELRLRAMGWEPLLDPWHTGSSRCGLAYDIPAQGLGMFSAMRDSWLGFNRHFLEFGGEEGYIHEKYRKAGRRCLMFPSLGWWHRFGRPEGARYRFTMQGKVRNYVLGFSELGLPLDGIRDHFIAEGLQPGEWDRIVADPVNYRPAAGPPVAVSGRPVIHPQPAHVFDLSHVMEFLRVNPRDINEHFDAMIGFGSKCKKIVELSKRRETVFPWIASGAEVVSYNEEVDAIQDYAERFGAKVVHWDHNRPRDPEPCDLAFFDTRANGERLLAELSAWGPNCRFMAAHDTQANGEIGDDGKAGMWSGMKQFIEANPDWFVAYHAPNQYGFTVLSRDPEFRPDSPVIPWPPGFGPGTEMFHLLESIGVTERPGCSCKAVALQMDYWGVEGCRLPDRYEWILQNVKANAEKWTWAEKLRIAASAATTSAGWKLAWKINPLKLEESLIDEAIRRAEEKGCETKCANGCTGDCRRVE